MDAIYIDGQRLQVNLPKYDRYSNKLTEMGPKKRYNTNVWGGGGGIMSEMVSRMLRWLSRGK